MERARLQRRHPEAVPVSALTGEGIETVLARIADALPRLHDVTLLVPHDRPDVVPRLYREEEVAVDGRRRRRHARPCARVGARPRARGAVPDSPSAARAGSYARGPQGWLWLVFPPMRGASME